MEGATNALHTRLWINIRRGETGRDRKRVMGAKRKWLSLPWAKGRKADTDLCEERASRSEIIRSAEYREAERGRCRTRRRGNLRGQLAKSRVTMRMIFNGMLIESLELNVMCLASWRFDVVVK